MTSLADRPNSALVVVDVQNNVVTDAYRRDEVVATIGELVERARRENAPVIWIQHADDEQVPGTHGWRIVPELPFDESEPVVSKRYNDSFEATALEAELQQRGVGRLIVTGAQTDACVRATLHGAFVRGYDTVLVADAHTTSDLSQWGAPPPEQVIAHTNLYWRWQAGPGRIATVVDAADVEFVATDAGDSG